MRHEIRERERYAQNEIQRKIILGLMVPFFLGDMTVVK